MRDLDDVTVDPAVGQVYKVERNETYYQILYVDEQVVLLRSSDAHTRNKGNAHRIEKRVGFDQQVKSGWFVHQPDSELDMTSHTECDWSNVSYIGEKTNENLHENGYETTLDIQQAQDDDLLSVSGLGQKGLQQLRSYAR